MNYKLTLREGVTVRDAVGLNDHISLINLNGQCIVTYDKETLDEAFEIEPIGMPFHIAIRETGKVRRIDWVDGLYVRWSEPDHAYVDKAGIRYTPSLNGKDWVPVEDD
jgi:hypothetical protein